ncbi:hypothetical protein MPL1032_130090 [Mesorhizobium plurifarium]|uniref:Uncharacterized protein n=1 Tax=Mesorhizobium plurifarium TaxID=69974 RepID=A0A0K2VQA3_MESPL|nr:hypothetical protein MPL1032_130090 [Mesorhizobium plurifarium]
MFSRMVWRTYRPGEVIFPPAVMDGPCDEASSKAVTRQDLGGGQPQPAPNQPGFKDRGQKIQKASVVRVLGGGAFQRLEISVKWLASTMQASTRTRS